MVSDTDALATFRFRDLHRGVSLGTASDRYAGWIGQIYSESRYKGRVRARTKKLGARSFREQVLPVDSVAEYFEHFRTLEVDYTFYQPLLDDAGDKSRTHHVLEEYAKYVGESDRLLLKVPQAVTAKKLRRPAGFIENPEFLNAERFVKQFYAPAQAILGERLGGFIFEQEYQRRTDRVPPQKLAQALDSFFSQIPQDSRYHIELRTESYLSKPVFDVLAHHGVGQVLSHWTWLPPLSTQFTHTGNRFFNSGHTVVIRLLTPIGVRYEDAYAMAHPFDHMVEGMLQPRMIGDTAALMSEGLDRGQQVQVIVNNRAGGNAPRIAQRISEEFQQLQRTEASQHQDRSGGSEG